MMNRFCSDRAGNFGLLFALLSVPVLGASGVALDYLRLSDLRTRLQVVADQAALSAVSRGSSGDVSADVAHARKAAQAVLSPAGVPAAAVNLSGEWVTAINYQVTISSAVPLTVLSALPGFPDTSAIGVDATAEVGQPKYTYGPPTLTQLDQSAADYNRLSVYCFDPDKASDPKTHGRTKLTTIADNGGTTYRFTMPQCDEGQAMSYMLYNVRNARTQKKSWDSPPRNSLYTYYTDTVIRGGQEQYTALAEPMLETVLCDTTTQCSLSSSKSVIPQGAYRTPQRATKACSPGKYLYYGWEDRPPSGGSDQDYNDLRIVIGCPTVTSVGQAYVRLTD